MDSFDWMNGHGSMEKWKKNWPIIPSFLHSYLCTAHYSTGKNFNKASLPLTACKANIVVINANEFFIVNLVAFLFGNYS